MNNQEKLTTRSNKVKVHIANSQTISFYPVRFSTDILFSSIVSFAFFFRFSFGLVFLKIKIYILIHIQLCGRVTDKNIFNRLISENKTTFFGPSYKQSLCCSDFFCSLPNDLVCVISGGYTRCDFYSIFSATI